jgi:hypothetical protein
MTPDSARDIRVLVLDFNPVIPDSGGRLFPAKRDGFRSR